jgi:hypothetical protein
VTLLQRRLSYRFATNPDKLVTTAETELRRIRGDLDVVKLFCPSLPSAPARLGQRTALSGALLRRPLRATGRSCAVSRRFPA